MGSKARIAKHIVPIIQKYIDENSIDTYIEPFVGGSNLIQFINCKNKIAYDNNEYLIEFWKQALNGWDIISEPMTKEKYDNIKDNIYKYPKHIVALAGLLATYNAKWFGGYAGIVQTKTSILRNYYEESKRNVVKQLPYLQDVEYFYSDYQTINIPNNCVVYCDPPYEKTTKYKDDFNHKDYWEWVREISKNNIVICSEYNAPDDFECIWSGKVTTTLDKSSRSVSVEKLFIHKKLKRILINDIHI